MSSNPLILMEEISRRLMHAFKDVLELCRNSLGQEPVGRLSDNQVQQIDALQNPFSRQPREPVQRDVRERMTSPAQERRKEIPKGAPIINLEQAVPAPTKAEKPPAAESKDKKPVFKKTRSGRARKGKAYSDPELPKKPVSSYIMFQRDRKPALMYSQPSITLTEMSKELGKEWHKLDTEAKKKYQQEFSQAKLKYEKDMEYYRRKHPEYVEPKRKKKVETEKYSNEVEEEECYSSGVGAGHMNGQRYDDEDSLGEL